MKQTGTRRAHADKHGLKRIAADCGRVLAADRCVDYDFLDA